LMGFRIGNLDGNKNRDFRWDSKFGV
jgi:hypothetical protein